MNTERLARRVRDILGPYNDDRENLQVLVSNLVLKCDELTEAAKAKTAPQIETWIKANSTHNAQVTDLGAVVLVKDLRDLFAGKVLVPVEPTDAMIDALFPGTGTHTCRELYKAMLAASQEQKQ
jgi:hypothetical protein